MTTPKRMPKEGERIRVLFDFQWIWADVSEVDEDGWMLCYSGMLRLHRRMSEEGIGWRFPEDDPEVCGERPAFKDKP